MNGHTVEEIQNMIKISQDPGFNMYWVDPKLIGPDGRANPEYLMPPTTPGEFGPVHLPPRPQRLEHRRLAEQDDDDLRDARR